MSDIRELYQELILDHNKSPRNWGCIGNANHIANGYNPLCGDKIKIYLEINENEIHDIRFEGQGCAISIASASMMTETLKGKSEDEAQSIFHQFHSLLTEEKERESNPEQSSVGKLTAFAGVREYPIRVKCATLPWHTMRAAINNRQKTVTTE